MTQLQTRVFSHSEDSFSATSTLIYGEKDAILIDAPFLRADAYRMAADIIEMGVNVTHIYASHWHPDHFYTAGLLKDIFPEAKYVALPESIKDMIDHAAWKQDQWGTFFGNRLPKELPLPLPLAETTLTIEGETIELIGGLDGDVPNNSVVWIPSTRTLVGTDVVYDNVMVWTIRTTHESRQKWRETLKTIREMNPSEIIPGHHDPALSTGFGTQGLDYTEKFLDEYEAALAETDNGGDLLLRMREAFPGVTRMERFLQWNIAAIYPDSPEWIERGPYTKDQAILDNVGTK